MIATGGDALVHAACTERMHTAGHLDDRRTESTDATGDERDRRHGHADPWSSFFAAVGAKHRWDAGARGGAEDTLVQRRNLEVIRCAALQRTRPLLPKLTAPVDAQTDAVLATARRRRGAGRDALERSLHKHLDGVQRVDVLCSPSQTLRDDVLTGTNSQIFHNTGCGRRRGGRHQRILHRDVEVVSPLVAEEQRLRTSFFPIRFVFLLRLKTSTFVCSWRIY